MKVRTILTVAVILIWGITETGFAMMGGMGKGRMDNGNNQHHQGMTKDSTDGYGNTHMDMTGQVSPQQGRMETSDQAEHTRVNPDHEYMDHDHTDHGDIHGNGREDEAEAFFND
ncbi:MAG TPA: hypothetical protein DHV36_24400 [Desulfobacteraceae bacterium]|nr:hypothetical protein [Desulfobacteraceae bacterium]